MRRKCRSAHVCALLLLAACFVGYTVQRIHLEQPRRQGLVNEDLERYYYPTARFLHDELGRGHLPLWNPYQFAGQPFVGLSFAELFYPPNLVLGGPSGPPGRRIAPRSRPMRRKRS